MNASSTDKAEIDDAICFHCGSPIPSGARLLVAQGGRMRPVCCHGCQMVAQTIIEGGFDAYYTRREATALQSSEGDARTADELAAYDDADFQASFTRVLPEGVREVVLTIEGIRCAACVWLNEQAVQRLPGIVEFHINLMTERAVLRWSTRDVRLSQILKSMEVIGYRAYPFDRSRHEAIARATQMRMLRQLFIAGIGMMQVMMYIVPFYVADIRDIEPEFIRLMQWASLVLTIPVVTYSASDIIAGAWRDVRNRRVGMDVPVAVAVVAAFVASGWHTLIGRGEVYFDSVTMFIFLLLCGRYLEFMARRKALQGVDALMRVIPRAVTRLVERDGVRVAERAKLAELVVGDVLEIKPGETLAVDGTLLSKAAEIDLALLTGESVPVLRQAGDALPAGGINIANPIEMRVERLEADNMVSAIQRLIDRAAQERPRIATYADRIASWFLAALLVFAVLVGGVWWWLDPDRALPIVIALLVVSCPCALSLATPAALASVTGALAQRGFLVTRGQAIETLASVTDVVFDKTGTLTQAQPVLDEIICLRPEQPEVWLGIAAALERSSEHPYGRALVAAARSQTVAEATDIENLPGRGLVGRLNGQTWRIGSWAHVSPAGANLPASDAEDGRSRVYLADAAGVVACFCFATPIRAGAAEMVASLQRRGVRATLLSGDGEQAVAKVAAVVGIHDHRSALSPEEKLAVVRNMQAQGRVVAMVGDGINDAPVLSGANVAIAMGDGTDLAQMSADIVLLSRDLSDIANGVGASVRAMQIIRQNLGWSVVYNGLAIPAAAFGWITPWVAALGMSLSSLLVVLNAMRLLRAGRRSVAPRHRTMPIPAQR